MMATGLGFRAESPHMACIRSVADWRGGKVVKNAIRSSSYIATIVYITAACSGCSGGGSLINTSWTVTEIHAKTDEDKAAIAGTKSIFVEFLGDGRLRTSVKRADGTVDREEQETYRLEGDTIVITHPRYERRVNARLSGDTLTVSSDKYDARLERYVPPEASQPAMFRPSTVGRAEYRSMSGMGHAGGRR